MALTCYMGAMRFHYGIWVYQLLITCRVAAEEKSRYLRSEKVNEFFTL